jgi:hypothetical protein
MSGAWRIVHSGNAKRRTLKFDRQTFLGFVFADINACRYEPGGLAGIGFPRRPREIADHSSQRQSPAHGDRVRCGDFARSLQISFGALPIKKGNWSPSETFGSRESR